ncbi:hypothetical protein Tco_0112469 [Tanacetum coccineum]
MSTNEQTPLSQPTSAEYAREGASSTGLGKACFRCSPTRVLRQELPLAFTNHSRKSAQDKVQQEKLKAVKAHLNFEEVSQHSESGTPNRRRDLKKRLGSRHVRICLETRGRLHPYTRMIHGVSHIIVAAETLKAATRVLA